MFNNSVIPYIFREKLANTYFTIRAHRFCVFRKYFELKVVKGSFRLNGKEVKLDTPIKFTLKNFILEQAIENADGDMSMLRINVDVKL